jgi:hypothetical protein
LQIACFRKPILTSTASNQAIQLTYLKNGMYTTLLAIVIVASIGDMPFSQLRLHTLSADAKISAIIHVATIAATVLTMTSMIGDKRLLGEGFHHIENNVLSIRLGVRASANIPLHYIKSAALINEKHALLLNTDIFAMIVTPFDKPNVVLCLEEDMGNDATIWFKELESLRSTVKTVRLYVDMPEKLIHLLQSTKP